MRLYDWYTTGHLAGFVRWKASRSGISAVHASQPPGDMSDPPVSELIVFVNDTPITGSVDFCQGMRHVAYGARHLGIIPPGTPTCIHVDVAHKIRILALPVDLQSEESDWSSQRSNLEKVAHSQHTDPCLSVAFERLWARMTLGGISPLAEDEAAVLLARRVVRMSGAPAAPGGRLAPWQLKRACEMMADQLSSELRLRQIASEVHLSMFHFCRAFAATTGVPPAQWLTMRRIHHALGLLRETKRPVVEIALDTGYASQSAFTAAFTRNVGVSPHRWRQLNQP